MAYASRHYIPGASFSESNNGLGYETYSEMLDAAKAKGYDVNAALDYARNREPEVSTGSRFARTNQAMEPVTVTYSESYTQPKQSVYEVELSAPASNPDYSVSFIHTPERIAPDENPSTTPFYSTQVNTAPIPGNVLTTLNTGASQTPSFIQPTTMNEKVYEGGTMEPFIVTPEKFPLGLILAFIVGWWIVKK